MRLARLDSWRFAEGTEQLPLAALFVRDTTGLEVPTNPLVPPPLEGELPDHSRHLDENARVAAGVAWLDWWKSVIEQEIQTRQEMPDDVDHLAWLQQRSVEHQALFDRPDFASFANRPALRKALRMTSEEALRWGDTHSRSLRSPQDGGQFEYKAIRKTAKQIARQYRASPGDVRACALILPVAGRWWQRFTPGAILCSANAARDPTTARTMLIDAFASGLPDGDAADEAT